MFKCPKCGKSEETQFKIFGAVETHRTIWVDNECGCIDSSGGDIELTEDAEMQCCDCDHQAPVHEFTVDEDEAVNADHIERLRQNL
jgi:hypothetical protein